MIIAEEAAQLRTQITSLKNKVPIHEEAKPQPKDFLAQLLDDPENQKLPFIKDVKEGIALVEQRIGKKVNEHLGFVGDLKDHGELYVQYSDKPEETGFEVGDRYLGEWSKETNKPHGRGI